MFIINYYYITVIHFFLQQTFYLGFLFVFWVKYLFFLFVIMFSTFNSHVDTKIFLFYWGKFSFKHVFLYFFFIVDYRLMMKVGNTNKNRLWNHNCGREIIIITFFKSSLVDKEREKERIMNRNCWKRGCRNKLTFYRNKKKAKVLFVSFYFLREFARIITVLTMCFCVFVCVFCILGLGWIVNKNRNNSYIFWDIILFFSMCPVKNDEKKIILVLYYSYIIIIIITQ